MNTDITIGQNSASGSYKHVKASSIVILASAALALSAAAGLSGALKSNTPAASYRGVPSTASAPVVEPRSFVYFVTGSQVEANLLAGIISSERASFESQVSVDTQVLVIATKQDESLLTEGSRELTQAGAQFRIVDLREATTSRLLTPIVPQSALERELIAASSAQEIMALGVDAQ